MGAAEAASGQMTTGTVSQISVKTEKGTIVLLPAGIKAILTVLTEPEAQIGLIFYEMERRASQVDEILWRDVIMKKTHIPKLDDFLGGGIPAGLSIIFSAVPGVECEAFGYQILNGIIEDGNKGFIFTNVTEPNNIIYEFKSYGWDIEKYLKEEKVFFVDGSSKFIGLPPMGKYSIDELYQIEELLLKLLMMFLMVLVL